MIDSQRRQFDESLIFINGWTWIQRGQLAFHRGVTVMSLQSPAFHGSERRLDESLMLDGVLRELEIMAEQRGFRAVPATTAAIQKLKTDI